MRYQYRSVLSHVLSSSSILAVGCSLAASAGGAALAQEEEAEEDRVVVTGSRIVRQDFTANSPIVTVDAATFENTTAVSVESVLNQLPQFVPDARSEFRTTAVEPTPDQTPGTSNVNLRGLGANRSLVLIDGRRAMPVNAGMVVDTNSISPAAIQRVEIISGGASAVYGADAVGGVVNFILRDNFEGLNVSAQVNTVETGGALSAQASGLWGANFGNDRGNVMFGANASTREAGHFIDYDWLIEQADNPNIANPIGFSASGPSTTYWAPTQRPAGVPAGAPSQAAVNALFDQAAPGAVSVNSQFHIVENPLGQGRVYTTGAFTFQDFSDGSYRYDGPFTHPDFPGCPFRDTLADGSIVEYACYQDVNAPLTRYTTFGRGRLELNDWVAATIRGNFATTSTKSNLNYAGAYFLAPVGTEVWTGNDYSPSSVLANGNTHPDYLPGGRYGLNCPATGGCTQSQAFPLPPELVTLLNSRPVARRNDDIRLNTYLDWQPQRSTYTKTYVYQVELGFEGELDLLSNFTDDWFWDVSVSHGESNVYNTFEGFGDLQRFQAIASSPNFGRGFQATGNPTFGGASAGTASCTSGLPVIRDFAITEDCIKAYDAEMQNNSFMEQRTFEANLTGSLFDLPAGPLQFATGVSYRENDFRFTTDILNDLNNFYNQPLGLFPKESSAGYISVSEIYGELLVPIVSDLPLIQQFNLELGGRLSDYDPSGTVETFKVLGDWQVTDWARLRGGWNRATRAPNLQELFSARQQSVAAGGTNVGDPCSLRNDFSDVSASVTISRDSNGDGVDDSVRNLDGPAGATHARNVCEALMRRDAAAANVDPSTGVNNYYNRPLGDFPELGSGGTSVIRGNPTVGAETANTYTLGLVLTSPFSGNAFLEGFTASVDYYRIKIEDLISVVDTPALFNDCLGLTTNPGIDLSRFSCVAIVRDPLDGDGLFVDRTYTNEGRADLSGVDIQLTWRGEFDEVGLGMIPGGASLNILATIPVEQITQSNPQAPEVDAVGTQYSNLGVGGGGYEYTTLTTLNYFVDDWTASLSWQYSPSIEAAAYATDPNTSQIGVPTGASLFNLSGSYRVNDTITLRAGVDNLFDTLPPCAGGDPNNTRFPMACVRGIGGFGSSGAGAGAYDILGRRYFFGIDASF